MKKIIYIIFVFQLFIALIGCDIEGVTDGFDIEISNDILKQEILVSVNDLVNPENLEGDNKLQVEVLGDNANYIVTNAGENHTNLKVIDGNISLAVNPTLSYSEPLKVLLKISGDGYLTTTLPIEITSEDTLITQSINIVNKTNTIEGVDYIENSTSLTNNTLSSNYTIATPALKATTKTEIIIESGTTFLDANGDTITGTNLASEVAHFSLDNEESIASFPGTLSPLNVIDDNGNLNEDSAFITAGFTSIDMFVDGTEVKNFSKPITISVEIPNDYINPETGANIAVGDQIPIWSYDDDGQWTYEKIGTVVMNTSGNYSLTFTTTHLSWYNLDFWISGCNSYRRLDVVAPANSSLLVDSFRLSYDVVYASNNQALRKSNTITLSKTSEDITGFYRTPNSDLRVKVYYGEGDGKTLVYTSEVFNGCSSNIITLDTDAIIPLLPPYESPKIRDVNVQYEAYCGDRILRPFFYIYRYESAIWWGNTYYYWKWVGYSRNGKGIIYNTRLGESQRYKIYYRGQSYEYDFTFDSENIVIDNFNIPQELCDQL